MGEVEYYEYGMLRCIGPQNMRKAVDERVNERPIPWEIVSITFGGMVKVENVKGALVKPGVPENATLPLFWILIRRPIQDAPEGLGPSLVES